ncbi:MAG: class I SAM-dependent methyltransferase [Nanoarchaeota archaeon]|nr:class I SAM-dependent methyltransferase [Nanoarchaeota archaeon]
MKEEKLTRKLYNEIAQKEWKRLVKDEFHKLEFDTSLYFLKKHLPKKGLILDAGGGPGRYTIELAKQGYDVVLLDLTPANLELAKKKIKKEKVQDKVKDVVEGSITDLSSFKSNSFDAVICLGGPLSHVHPEKQRKKAIFELIRVAKKNAPVFVSVMGRLGVIIDSPKRFPGEIKMAKHFKEYALKGDDYMWHGGKGYCHFFLLEEFEKLFGKKAKILDRIGLEGLASPNREGINKNLKDKKIKKNWLDMHYKLCTHSSVVDLSQHIMIIGRKK